MGQRQESVSCPWEWGVFCTWPEDMGRDEMQTADRDQIVERFDVITKDVDLVL